jgi:branched-chain amino acid transport system substrate-binding protein
MRGVSMSKKAITKLQGIVLAVIIIVAVLAVAIAYVYYGPAPEEKKEIRIGVTISTVGAYSFASLRNFKGMQLWVDDVNQRGGIYVKELDKTLPVHLVYYDDRSDKERVTVLYERFITEDNVDVLIAPFGSTLTLAAAIISEKHKIFMATWSASSMQVFSQGYKYLVSTCQQSAPAQVYGEIDYYKSLGITKVGYIYSEEAWPISRSNESKSYAEAQGMEVVLFEKFVAGTKDFTPLIEKARTANPEALVMTAYMDDQVNFARQLKEAGIVFPVLDVHYAAMNFYDWVQALGNDGLYFIGSTAWFPKVDYDVNVGFTTAEFMEAIKEKFGVEDPTVQEAFGYTNGIVLEEIIKKAGSLKADKLKTAALELSGKLTTLSGVFRIRETGEQIGMQYLVCQVQKAPVTGEITLEIIWPLETRTADPVYPMPPWG